MSKITICLAGNEKVGKTCMVMSYVNNSFPTDDVPGVFDEKPSPITVEGKELTVSIRDTRGGEDYERITAMAFGGMDVFLLCFSVTNRKSFTDITEKWNDGTNKVKNIMNIPRPTPMSPLHYVPDGTPLLLVALKIDDDDRKVTTEEGQAAARQIHAVKYLECSSLTRRGLKEVFDQAILAAMAAGGGKKGKGKKKSSDGGGSRCVIN